MNHVEKLQTRPEKETIHSGHFMVSHFEAEAQDDFEDLVPVPEEEQNVQKVTTVATYTVPSSTVVFPFDIEEIRQHQQLSIEVSLTKLFKCMTIAYRQKLTSPKWNRFKGIKLRWKDKIRLNNVIWRCWHMQFIKKQNTLVCQFASPLDVDTHVKPETTILEGKYWKRRVEAVTAEYKKWRRFHIMRLLGKGDSAIQDTIADMDTVESFSQGSDLAGNMLTDEDYLNFMTDTLFSTILPPNHQPFAFPDCREIARGASLADFIQPSLGPLQPNLDDIMDTLEPLQELLSSSRLAPVPEESPLPAEEALYRGALADPYAHGYMSQAAPPAQMTIHGSTNSTQMMPMTEQTIKNEQMRMYDNGRYALGVQGSMEVMYGYEQEPAGYKPRPQYATPKPAEPCYVKYAAGVAPSPSQTAPETVSLLQQPVQNSLLRGAYRDKPRQRAQYPPPQQHPPASYPTYTMQQSYEPRRQMQYLQPTHSAESYKPKPLVASRSFKMPSPPALAPPTQAASVVVAGSPGSRGKEQFRSHSLPLGAQLNADWSVSAPAPAPAPAPSPAPALAPAPAPDAPVKHVGRARGSTPGALRLRSRSSSGGVGEPAPRRPPPLNSVNSEPSLPQASVMLAQLLSAHHSPSLYKSTEECSEPTKSPVQRALPSPGSDVMSPHQSLSPPTSPGSPRAGSPREPRRTHLHAEQKRRYNIKNGFDTLQALIPHLNANPAAKISKAAMLQKGAEYIKQLKAERNQIKEEMESLRQQIECLNNSISNCHSLLPATGAPVSRARAGRLREMFARHVANRTMHNWKYWLFSVVSAALVESFSACVSCGSGADLVRTTLLWAEQHCSLVEMRPAVLNSLRVLCTTTDILTSPERLPEEARAAVAASAPVKTEPT